jgi:tRNA pseudouridine55 synthase
VSTDGVLVANKPRGITSHDVVNGARKVFGTRTIGHAGTLDPMASGVLVVLVGQATKLAAYLTAADKEYWATVAFGRSTDTLDADGRTVSELALGADWLDEVRLLDALRTEREREAQRPPEFSAVSVGGERAYRRARRGESITLEPRPVRVNDLELVTRGEFALTFRLRVSKGYYVRAFARDLASSLGVPAHLSELVRLSSGPFHLRTAAEWPPKDRPELLSVSEAARRSLGSATLCPSGVERASVGKPLSSEDFVTEPPPQTAAWFADDGRLVALGCRGPDGTYRVQRGFHP